MTRRFAGLGCTFAATLVSTLSAAQARDSRSFEFGAGLDGSIGLALLDAPTPAELTLPRSGNQAEVHGMSGLGVGAGIFVEARLFSRLGLHVGAGYSRDVMSGDLEVGNETVEVVLEHPALVVPILMQGFLPLGSVTPFVALGPELVVPAIPLARTEPQRAFPVSATADSHVRLSFGGGVELRLPVTALDLRVPLGVRGTWHPGGSDELGERVRVLPSDVLIYDNAPRYTLRASAGIGIYF